MLRRVAFLLVLVPLLLAAGTAAGDPGDEKRRIDERLGELRDRIEHADRTAGVLTGEISAVTSRIRTLQQEVAAEQVKLVGLERTLRGEQEQLARLTELLREQTLRLELLQAEERVALDRLAARVRQLYVEDTPDTLSFVLDVSSFSDLIDNVEYLNDIGRQDDRIATGVARARAAAARTRRETRRTRAAQERTTRAIAARYAEQAATRDRLVASRDALAAARSAKAETLEGVQHDRAEFIAEADALARESAKLAAAIQAAQARSGSASTGSGVSSSGLLWPVSGPVTSGFGWRWGRMHEGVDIAVGNGTAVRASAAGTVIHAGWLGGYGNLVVIDHGNGLSTAYAHNSGYAVSAGQSVSQGQVVAYSGNTGNSTGPHVHFEVRVNGGAVDPLRYL